MSTGENNGQGLGVQADVVRGGQLWRSPEKEMEPNREIICCTGDAGEGGHIATHRFAG